MKSLKTTIYIQIILLIIVANLITGIIFFISSIREINEHLMEEAEQISKRTAQSLAFPFWNIDSVGVNEIIDAQMQSANMHSIKLSEISKKQHFTKGLIKNNDGEIIPFVNGNNSNLIFSIKSPIKFENELLGYVTISLSDKVLRSLLIKNQFTSILTEMIVLILLAFPLTFIITSSFIRPIKELAKNFEKVVDTDFETAVASGKSHEIDTIAKIFEKVRLTILNTFAEIRKNEKNLSITLNSITDGIIATDEKGYVRRLNPIAEKLTGYSSKNAIGETINKILKLDFKDEKKYDQDIIEEIQKSKESISLRAIINNANNDKKRIVDMLSSHILDEKNKDYGIVIVFRDITEQLHIEEELNQSRKMESLGQLSGGVAHDFNNMLGAIIGFSEQLKDNAEPNSKEYRYSGFILEAAETAADLTAKLLAFSRKGKMISTPVSIHNCCETVISILSRTINKNISIIKNLEAKEYNVVGDPSQIQNAILNLCINAKDAMPKGGTLTLESQNVVINGNNGYKLSDGKYIKIIISDTGIGVPEDIKQKIFEPFFTTKETGKGTGLGLAAVYGSIKNHHGDIYVESSKGEGATFTFLLPVIENEIITKNDSVENFNLELKKRILVVDDEKMLREMLKMRITGMGGEILEASDGIDAIDIFREKHNDIDIVILDMVMPKMNGDICFYKLQEIDKSIPIIVTSGFDKNEAISKLLGDGAVGYLHKPFNVLKLKKLLYSL